MSRTISITTEPNKMLDFKQKLMQLCFDLVCDPDDWKKPIDIKIGLSTLQYVPHHENGRMLGMPETALLNLLRESIIHFTATTPTITKEGEYLVIKAKGYRMGPAGDH